MKKLLLLCFVLFSSYTWCSALTKSFMFRGAQFEGNIHYTANDFEINISCGELPSVAKYCVIGNARGGEEPSRVLYLHEEILLTGLEFVPGVFIKEFELALKEVFDKDIQAWVDR